MTPLRILDSGLRPPRAHLAMTEALCRGVQAGSTPDTVRFQHFPPSAIIGRHQILAREVNLGWCAQAGIATARRMTGGGAIVMGPGMIGWEVVLARAGLAGSLGAVTERLCVGLAQGLSTLGIAAHYRPRNDIEVEGRKISGTGGYFDGECLVFQGTVLIDLDRALLTNALHLPAGKLGRRGLENLADRITDLATLLGEAPPMPDVIAAVTRGLATALGREPVPGSLLMAEEEAAAAIHDREIGLDRFVEGHDEHFPEGGLTRVHRHASTGGTLDIAVKLRDGHAGIVDQIVIAGDFFVTPPRIIADLEAHLRDAPLSALPALAQDFLTTRQAAFLGLSLADVAEGLTAMIGEQA